MDKINKIILNITVRDKVATYDSGQPPITCDNDDYRIHFDFDENWNSYAKKVAHFVSNGEFIDKEFNGNEVDVPVQVNTVKLEVGVYIDGVIRTTTSAAIPCRLSALSNEATPSIENDKRYLNEAREVVKSAREDAAELLSAFPRAFRVTQGLELKKAEGTSGKYLEIIGLGSATDEHIVLPAEVDGYPLKTVHLDERFGSAVKSVYIPHTPRSAIYFPVNCLSALESIVVDERNPYLKSIDGVLFLELTYGNGSFQHILVGYPRMKRGAMYEVHNGVKVISNEAFYGNTFLEEVKLPDTLTEISILAFAYCDNLQKVVIPRSVSTIGVNAFRGCPNLTIYCEAESPPEGWSESWNPDDRPVVWGHHIDRLNEKADKTDVDERFANIQEGLNEKLDGKLDKVTTRGDRWRLYAINAYGEQVLAALDSAAKPYTLANRGTDCTFEVGEPTKEKHPVTLGYANEHYVPKVTPPTSGAWGAYYTKFDGSTGVMPLTNTVVSNTIPIRHSGGTVVVGTPTADNHAATKKYVDDLVGAVIPPEPSYNEDTVYAFDANGNIFRARMTHEAGFRAVARRDDQGRLRVAQPNSRLDAANKGYVDELIANLQAQIDALKQ